MIRAVSAADVAGLPVTSEALLRITAMAQVYGDSWQSLRFWMGEGGSVLSLADGAATLHAGEDAADACLFLRMSPDVRAVRTDAVTARCLSATCETGEVMTALSPISPIGETQSPPLAALYPLLQSVFGGGIPPFDVWYADVHHRARRGCFRAAAVMSGETVVSCALLTAQSKAASLIGGVATHSAVRGRGYATACVTALAAAEQAAGRGVWIAPKNTPAAALYRRLGFLPCGMWGDVLKP